MVSSTSQVIACILVIFGTAVSSQSQTVPGKSPTASISGKVTVKGKGIPGIVVIARDSNSGGGWDRSHQRGTTDQTGEYRIANLPAGTYQVAPLAPSFVVEKERSNNALLIAEGEIIEDVNFALVRGGVVTGRITDSDGEPLVEEHVSLLPAEARIEYIRHYRTAIQTDDRGVYRAFGLPQGKYKVSVGQGESHLPGGARQSYKQTFHPSVTDPAKATVIEVTEGSEIINVDIVMGRPVASFKVTGRIVDGETGKPLPSIMFGVSQTSDGGGGSSMSGATSNADGEFKFDSVLPGKYSVFVVPPQNNNLRADTLPFEVTDRDLTGLLIRTTKGASLSGLVVFDGMNERPAGTKPGDSEIFAWIENSGMHHEGPVPTPVNPDGSFKISSLRSGTAHIEFTATNRQGSSKFKVVRVERDGVPQPGGINLKDGEQIAGLRVIIKHLTGAIRGQVKIENGELPPSARVSVGLALLDDNLASSTTRRSFSSAEVDARGRFFIEDLAAGTYEVDVTVFLQGARHTLISRQEVSVADNAVSEVILTVKSKPNPGP